jgi:hypothetical protein
MGGKPHSRRIDDLGLALLILSLFEWCAHCSDFFQKRREKVREEVTVHSCIHIDLGVFVRVFKGDY